MGTRTILQRSVIQNLVRVVKANLRKKKVALDTVQIQEAQINQEEDKSMKLLMQAMPLLLTQWKRKHLSSSL